jgi:hypothetical protein
METSSDLKNGSLFTREQMLWIMRFLGANSLLGVNLKDSSSGTNSNPAADPEATALELVEKGILQKEDEGQFLLHPEIRPLLETLFFPDRALVVARDRPSIGAQIFYLLRRGSTLLLHSFPQEGEHILLRISQPADVVHILVDWFPLGFIPSSAADFLMERDVWDRIVRLAGRDDREGALQALKDFPEEDAEKTNLLRAIRHRKLSGSVASLVFQANIVDDASSINVLSDGLTAWTIIQEESSGSPQPHLRLRRTGADFAMIVREWVERFAGVNLPRQQTDVSAKVTRFVLTMDEIAMALASIHCPELSQKMAASASRESSTGSYPERMQAAQRTLQDHGLCRISAAGFPDLEPDLARAVFTIAQSDCMIDLKACKKDVPVNSCIHIVHGRFFTAYYNYGSAMQLLEFGYFKDLPAYLEFLFPDFGNEQGMRSKNIAVSYAALEKALESIPDREKAGHALRVDGLKIAETNALLEDLSDMEYRASFTRREAPEILESTAAVESVPGMPALLLLKSPRRSLLFRFPDPEKKGEALAVTQAAFLKEGSAFLA